MLRRINDELSELWLRIVHSKVIKSNHFQPFDHFGREIIQEETE
ncbi:hypothetical protein Htur_4081 (plasmid) [Haloterrigena turkmenica DSM 5511]|uniref:Uncharacterized protein n=1 Tax=Haloterrigena turkmenica (strain ATCC 51198 / DSM 5511 / JCM 9101 / NCIMB 13204 / VKM B-1734 / 4k) TaxID=543526 RepID=D2S0L9_HALTV|nr:hypothetical protein Htur_4081 [Haloterrigena turkmenica DSM 5511]